ncbi:glycosyltransferase [Ameyamaea chiangmaiensis]|nr:glycosyltransferase [Ameyamaea chiangmaiensis]
MAGAPMGGAELFFERLCAAQAAARDDTDVLAVIRREAGRAGRLRTAGVPLRQMGFGGALDVLTRARLRRALHRFAPRVVVAWMNRAARFTPTGPWVLAGRLGGFYDLGYYRHCDHLIGNTRGIVRWLGEQGWPTARAHYLPNFAIDFGEAAPVRPDYVPPSAPLVLALGRLHTNKAFDVLIPAMRRVPDAHLVIAGEGPERAALEALARQCGVAARVHMPGWVQQTAGLLAACDVLVCPSRHEPLGNVVIEAFSAGRPVVAARAQGPVELITPGEDGLLVPLEDFDALGNAIASVVEAPDLACRLGRAGRLRFEAEFASAPVLARWHDFLTRVGRG